jgi:hypothetical protein
MRTRASIALFLLLAALLGCTLPTTPPASTTTPLSGNWTNWQIQSGAAITSPPTGLYFTGAVQVQGTQSSAVFTSAGLTGAGPATVLNFLGTFNSSTGDVSLLPATTNSAAYGIGFTQPSTNTVIPVGIVGGCVYPLNYQGVECLALSSLSPAVGVQIAPLNGTYTGTLSGTLNTYSPFTSTPITGTTSVTFTQSATPNASGQFALTGTITFPSSSGMSPVTLPGLISGIPIWLNNEPCVVPFSEYAVCNISSQTGSTLNAYTNPTATQITITSLENYIPSGTTETGITLTGTLTLQ